MEEYLTVKKIKEKIKELQSKLNSVQTTYEKYKGKYIVIEEENLYMKVEDVGLDDNGEPCLLGDCVSLNLDDFYIDKNSELGLNWSWVNIKPSSREEYEKAILDLSDLLLKAL